MLLLFNQTSEDVETGWGKRCVYKAIDAIIRAYCGNTESGSTPASREVIKQKDSAFKDNS